MPAQLIHEQYLQVHSAGAPLLGLALRMSVELEAGAGLDLAQPLDMLAGAKPAHSRNVRWFDPLWRSPRAHEFEKSRSY